MDALSRYGSQLVGIEELESLKKVLNSGLLTEGPVLRKFENDVASYVGAKHCMMLNSATSALICALHAMGVSKGSVVWVPSVTFVATANSAELLGATVDFVDISLDTFNICLEDLHYRLEAAEINGCVPDVLVVVHMAGSPVEMEKVHHLCQRFGVAILEDASHALGASYAGEMVGSCTYSHAAVFSFHPVKMITTGEGGCVVTNDDKIAELSKLYSSHGISRDRSQWTNLPLASYWPHAQVNIGFNFRMSDLSAALGAAQLEKLDSFVQCREMLVACYSKLLQGKSVKLQSKSGGSKSSNHILPVLLPSSKKRNVQEKLSERGIAHSFHYPPVYLHPYYQNKYGFDEYYCPNARLYLERSVTLPLHCLMDCEDILKVSNVLSEAGL